MRAVFQRFSVVINSLLILMAMVIFVAKILVISFNHIFRSDACLVFLAHITYFFKMFYEISGYLKCLVCKGIQPFNIFIEGITTLAKFLPRGYAHSSLLQTFPRPLEYAKFSVCLSQLDKYISHHPVIVTNKISILFYIFTYCRPVNNRNYLKVLACNAYHMYLYFSGFCIQFHTRHFLPIRKFYPRGLFNNTGRKYHIPASGQIP